MKVTLLYFRIETSFIQSFEHFFDILVVCINVTRVYKYIIKIDYNTNMLFMNYWKTGGISRAEWY